MNYWLTVHWPLYTDAPDDAAWHYWVFLAEGYEQLGKNLQIGDRVFIYETKYAPRKKTNGGFISQKKLGKQGIIALVQVIGNLEPNPNAKLETYEDGRQLRWKFHAKTRLEKENFCPQATVCKVFGCKPRYYFRIPGGLRKLKEAQAKLLLKEFWRE